MRLGIGLTRGIELTGRKEPRRRFDAGPPVPAGLPQRSEACKAKRAVLPAGRMRLDTWVYRRSRPRSGGRHRDLRHSYRKMARVTGLEPATSGVTGRRSNQLSYTPAKGMRRISQRRAQVKARCIRRHFARRQRLKLARRERPAAHFLAGEDVHGVRRQRFCCAHQRWADAHPARVSGEDGDHRRVGETARHARRGRPIRPPRSRRSTCGAAPPHCRAGRPGARRPSWRRRRRTGIGRRWGPPPCRNRTVR